MQTKIYAPVVIPTLNRYEHFKRCLESLERCTDADKTDIYVGLDYPPSEKYVEGWKKIDAYLSKKEKNNRFRNLYVRRRDHNCGVGREGSNSRLLVNEIQNVYDRYIFSEDDNEFSPNFLSYCNWGLEYFKDDERIIAICGYNLIETPDLKNDVYIYNDAFNAWGAAFLFKRRKRLRSLHDLEKIKKIVDSYPLSIIFNEKVMLASSMLYMIKKNQIFGDTIIQAIEEDKKWCVFPKISKVRNWGHDGSGLHCGSSNQKSFVQLPIDESTTFEPHIEGELYLPEIDQAYRTKYGHHSKLGKIRAISRFLIYKTTGRIIVLRRPQWLRR